MARKKKKRRRKDKRVSALTVGGLLSNVFKQGYAGGSMYDNIMTQNWDGLAYNAREIFLGIDSEGKLRLDYLADTYVRPIAGFILSKVMTKLGVNREMKKIPFIGKYIKL